MEPSLHSGINTVVLLMAAGHEFDTSVELRKIGMFSMYITSPFKETKFQDKLIALGLFVHLRLLRLGLDTLTGFVNKWCRSSLKLMLLCTASLLCPGERSRSQQFAR